jgi:amidase
MADDFAFADATTQAELVRRRDASPRELVDAAIARIERLNPQLNAVIHPLFEKARKAAESPLPDGPFRGVPFLLKDILGTSAGDPYHMGMGFLRQQRWMEPGDAALTSRFRAAGLVVCGRTNVPELGLMPSTEPAATGPTRNPWDPTRSPGGSSGGSAAAVASGMVPVAHANDGGGSIRIPASACGLVGLKPSRGRTSLGPASGELWAGFGAEGVVSRSVRDTAAILDAIEGYETGDPYTAPAPLRPYREEVGADPGRLRIGLLAEDPRGAAPVHPDCAAAAQAAARLLASLGHRVEESHPTVLADPAFAEAIILIVTTSVARDLDLWAERTKRRLHEHDVEPTTWLMAEAGRGPSARDYIRAVAAMHAATREVLGWWRRGFDLLLTPTLPEPPTVLGSFTPTPDEPMRGLLHATSFVTFTMPFNATGQPAISLPLHWTGAGLPIGVQLVAAYGREDLLLRVAAQLEQAAPWAARRPVIHA